MWSGRQGAAVDGLLKRAVNSQDIVRYRRGVYGLSPRFTREKVHPFVLAQYIDGPSYISLESALSYHGWIPEAVYTVTSVSMNRSKAFETPVGLYSFDRIPQKVFFAGVRHGEAAPGKAFLLASPLKALVDYSYVHRTKWTSLKSLQDSLRIEDDELQTLNSNHFDELEDVYPQRRVREFIAGLRKELSL